MARMTVADEAALKDIMSRNGVSRVIQQRTVESVRKMIAGMNAVVGVGADIGRPNYGPHTPDCPEVAEFNSHFKSVTPTPDQSSIERNALLMAQARGNLV